ncbi:polysaccharide deacetylase family protein [Marinospirillum perlucidum]|uniref:polysaccharide deacetylase family protein n=1 Tax=Marinospirillum perlucidum TaxID=1982602 RepID=UPI000DF46188|nr:polysaccharide deacetylase family protein [Marinospirillum perlucidum]
MISKNTCIPLFILLLLVLLTSSGTLAEETTEEAEEAPVPAFHASILMYHHISSQTPPSTSTSVERFTEHLDLLEEEGFEVWPLDRIISHIQRRRPLPDKVAALTFDDAYASVYENALPLLEERELPFTIFVNAQPIDRGQLMYMTWDQLREAKEKGALIGNHSLTHTHMIHRLEEENEEAWLERMRGEVEENQAALVRELGEDTPKIFAYPYGEYNPQLQELLKELGYVAFGQHSGPASPYASLQALPRYAANGIYANPRTLGIKLKALPFAVIQEEPASGVLEADQRKPTLELTIFEGDFRIDQLRCYGPDAQQLRVAIHYIEEQQTYNVAATPYEFLNPGRSRYNCTAPHKTENRWFWFSRQWMLPKRDGTWYEG